MSLQSKYFSMKFSGKLVNGCMGFLKLKKKNQKTVKFKELDDHPFSIFIMSKIVISLERFDLYSID